MDEQPDILSSGPQQRRSVRRHGPGRGGWIAISVLVVLLGCLVVTIRLALLVAHRDDTINDLRAALRDARRPAPAVVALPTVSASAMFTLCLARYASLVNPASIPGTPQAWTRRLLRCGVAAGPVFVAVFLLEGAARDGYRPLRHPVSSLALGPRGWIQAGNFAMTGTLFLAGAAGLARAGDPVASRAAPALTGAAGAGLIGAAIFTTDPVSGYPPGTPDALTHPTRTGIAHNLAAVPVFVGLPAAALASGWRSWRAGQHRFGLYSLGTAVTMLTTTALAGAGFGQSPRLINLGGLFQRASIITGFAWLTALSAHALRRTPPIAGPRHQAG